LEQHEKRRLPCSGSERPANQRITADYRRSRVLSSLTTPARRWVAILCHSFSETSSQIIPLKGRTDLRAASAARPFNGAAPTKLNRDLTFVQNNGPTFIYGIDETKHVVKAGLNFRFGGYGYRGY
jgi:hypothetical protein